MRVITKQLVALLLVSVASLAGATTVYQEGYGPNEAAAATIAASRWRSAYPNGTYYGIQRCGYAGGATATGGSWYCLAYGDQPSVPTKVIVTTSAHGDPASLACQRAVADWNQQYAATGSFTGTTVIEVYGNGGNSRPTDFICTATGYILKN